MTTYSFRDIKDKAGNPMFSRGADVSSQSATNVVLGSQSAGDRWCIAVIDEAVDAASRTTVASTYATFRATWPNRKLFLLIPSDSALTSFPSISPLGADNYGSEGYVFVPQQATNDIASGLFQAATKVNRDAGVTGNRSDWFTLTGMGVLAPGAKVGLFVDNSGSMTTATVQASYNKFIADVAAAGLTIITVTNSSEDWISPFTAMSGT